MVAPATARRCRTRRVRHLRDVGGTPERPLLCRAIPFPLLLAVPCRELRLRRDPADRFLVDVIAGISDPLDSGRISPDLLLLSEGLLSVFFPIASGLRSARRGQKLLRRNLFSALASELSPVFFLSLVHRPGVPLVGCDHRIPLPRRNSYRPRHDRSLPERSASVA